MRLGGPVFGTYEDPDLWIDAVQRRGYRAAYCPVTSHHDESTISAFVQAAQAADILIAEVGAWSNPLSPDEAVRRSALAFCQEQLDLAERVGARCCVNISGSRGEQWDGPHPDNLTEDTFALIVDTVRAIVDAVNPSRTYYTLEPMPWMYPDSVDSYLRLIQAIDRERFAAHLDPVNLVCSPQLYYQNGALIRDCIRRLGPSIRSCHAKDIHLSERLTVHLDEVRPGAGELDYSVLLAELARLDPATPLMLEHLEAEDDYRLGAEYIRDAAQQSGITLA